MKTTSTLLGSATLALLLAATTAPATVVFDALTNPASPYGTFRLGTMDEATTGYAAQSFDMGSQGGTLSSVIIAMGNAFQAPAGATFTMEIYAAGSVPNTPGAVLGALTGTTTTPTTAGDYTYTPATTITLSANTTYYVGFNWGVAGGNAVYQADNNLISVGTDSLGLIDNSGAGWTQAAPANTLAAALEVNADLGPLSPVPEPADWAALSAAMLGSVWIVKRRMTPARA